MKNHHLTFCIIAFTLLGLGCNNQNEKPQEVNRYTIGQFYKNKKIGGGYWSQDDKKLLINTNETGIFNIYEITVEDGSLKQLTNSAEESFFAIGYLPGTSKILYTADKGGNENTHLYILQEDGSSTDLTPGENEKAGFVKWSADKKNFYYTSNKRDPRLMDVYKLNIETQESSLVYQVDEELAFEGISYDEQKIVLSKSITTSDNKLFILDKKENKLIEISNPMEPGNYSSSGFSKNSRNFYYITNAGKEFEYLVKYDIEEGKHSTVFETNWDVMYSYLSENEKYRVIAINEDGKSTLNIIDNASGKKVDFPALPDGDVLSVSISESEKWMRLTVGTSKAPSNIYAYSFESGKLKKLTESLNPEINPEDLVSAEVVRYKSFDGLDIPSIYYKPKNASASNKVPAVIWVHGGPGGQTRVGYFSLIQYLVNNGYAVLAVNNRGSSGYGKTFYKMDDQNHGEKDLQDCIWGKKWLQSQDYIDADKIGIMGGSYGGYMTMAAMTFAPEEFKVGVNIFGVTNWLRTLRSIPPYWESFRKALYAEMGDPNTADSVRLYNISPLFHADKVKNPVMVLQGANDPRVLQVESDEIVEAVKKNNVPVEYVLFPDEGHGFVKKENEIKGYGQILTFLDQYLKN
jgi:dipeptidyl aminopeptidase/acylaminoacyl peptidase